MHPPPQPLQRDGSKIVMKLDSNVYKCPDHGNFRIYISGAMEKYPG